MKKEKTIYWTSTLLLCLLAGFPAITYFTMPQAAEGFKHLGFPDFFRIELGTAKLAGTALLLITAVPARIKEWVYVGFGITFISAFIAHFVVDGWQQTWGAMLAMALLITSNIYYHKIQQSKQA